MKPDPLTKNPYKVHAVFVAVIAFVGLAAMQSCGWEPSGSSMVPFLTELG